MQFITTGNRIAVENFVLGDLYTITFTNGTYINSACIGIGENFVSFQRNEPELLFSLTMATAELVSSIDLYAGGTGTNNYNDLTNKPQINDVELLGNKSLSDLGIQGTISDIDTIRSGAAAGATAVQPAALADYQPKIVSSHKLDADLVNDTSSTNKFATAAQLSQIGINENNILLNAQNGVSNYINSADVTISASGYVLNALDCNIPQGDYYLKYTSTQTISGNIQVTLKDANNATVCDTTTTSTSGANLIPITLSDTAKTITIYSVRAGTYSNLQIIAKSLYDAGFTDYQPYAMSNVELTAAIQALQAQLNQ